MSFTRAWPTQYSPAITACRHLYSNWVADSLRITPRAPSRSACDRLDPVDRRGQQHRTHREPEVGQLLQRLQPVGPRHREIEQQDVGPELRHLRHRLVAVARFAHHLEAGVGLEQPAQAVAEDGMVVGDHDSDRARFVQAWCFRGIETSTWVPNPCWLRSAIRPPMARARSLMIAGPFRWASTCCRSQVALEVEAAPVVVHDELPVSRRASRGG